MNSAVHDNPPAASSAPAHEAQRWRIGGRVQGVGFRPFVYRLAHHYVLTGWVRNHGGEVEILAEGPAERLRAFGDALLSRAPPAAAPRLLDARSACSESSDGFRILASTSGHSNIHVPADLFTCDDCLTELRDPQARRARRMEGRRHAVDPDVSGPHEPSRLSLIDRPSEETPMNESAERSAAAADARIIPSTRDIDESWRRSRRPS